MATVQITIPVSFIQHMNQFMANVQKMQQLTTQFQYTVQNQVPVRQLYISHSAVKNRFQRLLQVFRKLSASMQSSIDAIMRAMGAVGQTFLRALAVASDILGPIIAATVTTVAVIGSAALGAVMIGSRFARWFWDKMVGLGDAMLQDFLTASGTFSTIGGVRAYRATFGAALNDPGVLSNTMQARGSMVSRQWAAMSALGLRKFGAATDMAVDATVAASFFMKMQQRGRELTMAEAYSLTSLFNPETLIRLRDMDESEILALEKMYKDYKPLMEVTDKAKWGWMNFSKQIQAAWVQIQTVIANKLADQNSPFVQALRQLSESLTHFFRVFIDSPITKELVEKLAQYIDQFVKKLKEPATKEKILKLMQTVKDIGKYIIQAIDYLRQMISIWSDRAHMKPDITHGRKGLGKRLGMARPSGAPPAAYPEQAPIARYPGRARFAEKIGIARAPGAPRIAPESPVRAGPRGGPVRQAPVEGIQPATGELRGGRVNSSDLYNTLKKKFAASSLNGYVPKDGARWGIKTGSPDEWARLGTAVAKQESGLNANVGGGGLYQMEAGDLRRYGVEGAVNDPNAQVQAMVNQWSSSIRKDGVVSQPAPGNPGPGNNWLGAGRYFGSMRDQGWHGKTQSDVDKYLGPNGWADQAQKAAIGTPVEKPSGSPGQPTSGQDTSDLPPAMNAATGQPPDAFIVHHTGGRGTPESVLSTLNQRGLGVEYVMDRDGKIYQIGRPGAANIMPENKYRQNPILGEGKPFLTNQNIVGMEVIAKDDKDVTPAQRDAAARFIRERYPNTPVFGHGEVNPGHKEPDEGMTITNAIRAERAGGQGQDPEGTNRLRVNREPWPEKGAKPVDYIGTQTPGDSHPINKVKVDNRSDADIGPAKDNSGADHSDQVDNMVPADL